MPTWPKGQHLPQEKIQVLFPFAIWGDIKFRNALFCLGFEKEGEKWFRAFTKSWVLCQVRVKSFNFIDRENKDNSSL